MQLKRTKNKFVGKNYELYILKITLYGISLVSFNTYYFKIQENLEYVYFCEKIKKYSKLLEVKKKINFNLKLYKLQSLIKK